MLHCLLYLARALSADKQSFSGERDSPARATGHKAGSVVKVRPLGDVKVEETERLRKGPREKEKRKKTEEK